MKTKYKIVLVAFCILAVAYAPIIAVSLGPENILNPASVLYFPGIVMQLVANEGNGIICVDACGPCSAWGAHHVSVDGVCKIPDNVEDCYYINPPMEWIYIDDKCVPVDPILNKMDESVRIEGKLAEQICSIIDTGCSPYYLGNLQDDGSVWVGFVVSEQEKTKHYQILIENDTIIDVKRSQDGKSQQLGVINPEKDIPVFFEIQLMEQNIDWEMPKRDWNNPDFEVEPPGRFCSQILAPNGTNQYISTIYQSPFSLSNMTFHDTMPDDCKKTLPVTQHGRK